MLSYKMILWGKTGTGKTSLLARLFNDTYDEKKRTDNTNYDYTYKINDDVHYQLFEFPDPNKGDSRDFFPTYAMADVILYCVDLRGDSNDAVINEILNELLYLNKTKGSKTDIILVATKNDTPTDCKTSTQVLNNLDLPLNGINGEPFIISAKTNTGIEALKSYLFTRAKTQEQPICLAEARVPQVVAHPTPTLTDMVQMQNLYTPILKKYQNEILKLPKHRQQGMNNALEQFTMDIYNATKPGDIDSARDRFIKKTNDILETNYPNIQNIALILAAAIMCVAVLMMAIFPFVPATIDATWFIMTCVFICLPAIPATVGLIPVAGLFGRPPETPLDKSTIDKVKENITKDEITKLNAPEP